MYLISFINQNNYSRNPENKILGMVSVCAGCDAYYPWVAAILGCIAGVVYLICSLILVKLKIDDPLDASPIHLGAGNVIDNDKRCC